MWKRQNISEKKMFYQEELRKNRLFTQDLKRIYHFKANQPLKQPQRVRK